MIRIIKPGRPPAVLRRRGAAATRRLADLYDAAPADYHSGDRTFAISRSIYSAPSVVAALRRAQHNKCCFCERKTLGDVEHFRPKSGCQQRESDALERPGYYWLAYEWSNLYFACGPCNQRFKRNLFPLRRPDQRALSHHHDLAREEPLLIDPGADNPVQHVGFRKEIAVPLHGSRRGRVTISVLQLNREELTESRGDQLRRLRLLVDARSGLERLVGRIKARGGKPPADVVRQLRKIGSALASAGEDRAEFAGMARGLLREAR